MPPFGGPVGGASTSTSSATWIDALGDVSDPSDWLGGSFAHLRDLDASLRCEICSDILRAPVSIKTCSHVFCSRCIRDYINQPAAPGAPTERPCPNCRQPKVYDSELVPVPPLEIAAEAWRKARPQMSSRDRQEREAAAQACAVKSVLGHEGSSSIGPAQKKRRIVEPSERDPTTKRLTRSAASSRAVDSPTEALGDDDADAIVVDDDSDDDWSPQSESRHASPAKKAGASNGHVASSSTASSGKSLADVSASDVVQCPMCTYTFTLHALNRHLDAGTCKGPDGPAPSERDRGIVAGGAGKGMNGWFSKGNGAGSSSASRSSAGPSMSMTKLKRPQYQLLSEKALRKACDEAGLATNGGRTILEARHRRYIDIFNANLDSSPAYRRSDAQLKREVREWDKDREREEAKSRTGAGGGGSLATNGSHQRQVWGTGSGGKAAAANVVVGNSEEDRRAYALSQRDHFKQLVHQGRQSHQKNKATHHDADDGESTVIDGQPNGTTSTSVEAGLQQKDASDDITDDASQLVRPVTNTTATSERPPVEGEPTAQQIT